MRTIFEYVFFMVSASFLGAILWLLLVLPIRKRLYAQWGIEIDRFRETAICFCFVYLMGLFALTLTPNGFWNSLLRGEAPSFPPAFRGEVNLIPLKQSVALLRYYIRYGLWGTILVNFPGNVILFIPLGIFYGLLSGKPKWWKNALLSLGISLFIECFQLFVSRGTDIDDLILNTFGGIVGYGLYYCLWRKIPKFVLRCRVQKKGRL